MAVLSDSEERLLEFVREGRMDAEIAVWLGVSTGEVKGRIERLCATVGAKDRAALRDGATAHGGADEPASDEARPEAEDGRPGRRIVAAVCAGVLAVALFGGWFVQSDSRRSPAISTTTDAPQAAGAAQPSPLPPTAVAPRATVVSGRAMHDVGSMFIVSGKPFAAIDHVDAREALTVVYLAAAGVARVDGGAGVTWNYGGSSSYQVAFAATIAGQRILLSLIPGDAHTHLVLGSSDSVAFYDDAGGLPILLLRATTFGTAIRWHVTANASGELFIATVPTPAAAVIDEFTGELLLDADSSVLQLPASLGTTNMQFTACDYTSPPSRCRAVWRATSPVLAPADGWAACDSSGRGTLTLLDSSVEIDFFPVAGTRGCGAAHAALVTAGAEMLDAGHYEITARDNSGQLSVAVAGERLYVGNFTGSAGCPCLHGN